MIDVDYTDMGRDSTRQIYSRDGRGRDKCRLYRHGTGQYKTDKVTRQDKTRQIYSRDGTVRD